MATLTQASRELFRRNADERFSTLAALSDHCRQQKAASLDRWHPPQQLKAVDRGGELLLAAGSDGEFRLNEWSFTQLCNLARITKDTVNRLSTPTASQVFAETLPLSGKPMQLLTTENQLRSVHGAAYTRLWNADLVSLISEFAVDFTPPQEGGGGGTGLYCGEQDLFCFLIDPTGWAEIGGQAFAPGFFVWNSEVGKRSVGVSTFWFQKVCANHIVWDATEVVEVSRKHTAGVGHALADIRRTLETLVAKRDARRDGFVRVMEKAMSERLGSDAEETLTQLLKNGIPKGLAKQALEIARQQGGFTIFSLVDALTRIAGQQVNAGDRLDIDARAAQLLVLAA